MSTPSAIPTQSNLSNFEYEPLPSPSSSIRLAVLEPGDRKSPIRVRLQQASFASKPKYKALSYTWGSPDVLKIIKLDGKFFKVRQNLWDALVHLRLKDEERVLWIDAICIDQSNLSERNTQVGLMAYIYTRAQRVIVWLGAISGTRQTQIDSTDGASEFEVSDEDSRRLDLVGVQPYWSRVWIVQEIGAAAEIDVHWELTFTDEMPAMQFSYSWDNFFSLVHNSMIEADLAKKLWEQRRSRHGDAFLLLNLMHACRESLCSEPRDKVYGFVGIAHDCQDGRLAVDYSKTLFQLYGDVVRFHQDASRNEKEFTDVIFFSQLVQHLLGGRDALEPDLIQGMPRRDPDNLSTSSPSLPGPVPTGTNGEMFTIAGFYSGRITIIGPTYEEMMGTPEAMKSWKVSIGGCKTDLEKLRRKNEGFMRTLLDLEVADLRKVASIEAPSMSKLDDSLLDHFGFAKDNRAIFERLPRLAAAPILKKPFEDTGPRLFATPDGVIGMMPSNARIGDLIIQYLESDAVALARMDENRNYYQIVGRVVLAKAAYDQTSKFEVASEQLLPVVANRYSGFERVPVRHKADMMTLHLLTC